MNVVGQEKTQAPILPPDGQAAIHVDMPNAAYHAAKNWSHSQLKWLPDDPEMFHWRFIAKREKFSPSRDMVMGSALHAWLLEGIEPTLVPREYLTKAGSMRPGGWADLELEFPGVPILKADEIVGLRYARENALADPEIRAYLETDGEVEHSIFSQDPETGLPTKVRLDKLCRFRDGLHILDLKFSAGVDKRWIDAQVTKMAYYRQAGLYTEHVAKLYGQVDRWVFLFAKNDAPYTARLKQLLPPDIDLGARHEHEALRDLRRRLDENDWHGEGYGHTGITTVAHWRWTEDQQAPEPFEEFTAFSGKEN